MLRWRERGGTAAEPGGGFWSSRFWSSRPQGSRPQGSRPRESLPGATFDLLAVVATVVLVGLGLVNIYAVDGLALAVRQAVIAAAGMVLFALLWRFRVRLLTVLGWVCYGTAVFFLMAVLLVGASANGATRWISLGFLTFQPSELGKLGLLLVLAAVLGSDRPAGQRFVLAVLLALVPIGLTLLQPDLSTSALLVAVTVAMVVLGRVPARFLLPLLGAAAVLAPLVIGLMRPYQLTRLSSFLAGSQQSPSGAGWAVQQARIALGSGGLLGSFGQPLHGLLAQYLPERDNDLALASLVEQWGMLAGAVAVGAAVVLVWRLALATRARTAHGAMVGGGLAILFGTETVVSLGGNLGLLPLAGVPFPLLSNGGTALVVHLAAVGVVLGIRRDGVRRRLWVPTGWRSRRPRLVKVAALGITVLLAGFALYGWRLRVVDGAVLAAAGQDQMTRCIRFPAPRGVITDRHGVPLATNADSGLVQVVAVPALVRAVPDNATRLARLTGAPVEAVRAALDNAPATTLAVAVAEVPTATGTAVAAAGITGVMVVPQPRRSYPAGALLGPVIGFTGVATPAEVQRWPGLPSGEIVGRAGIEQQYDAVLRGIDGQQCVYVTPAGVPVAMGTRTAPVPGATVRLTIDLGLQRELTAGLAAALGAPGELGGAVAMDPRTGQVLALASLPSYDDTIYGPPADPVALGSVANAPGSPLLDHVTQAAVPPGSTFKLVVATADLVHPVVPPEAVVPTGGSFTLAGHTFHNWRTFGPMNLVDSVAWSNDVYFYKLAAALGPDPMIDTAGALGVGHPTGIDLPGESAGYLGTPESVHDIGGTWYAGSTVILGIGQGYLTVTPLQNARWTAAVATGRLVTPHLGLAAGTDATAYTPLPAPAATPLPFADALGPVRDGMREAVTSGTATQLADLPVAVGAKTGTAEDGSLPAGSYDNWMTAAAPINDPSVVMTAMVQGPGGGANDAGAVVHEALRYYLRQQAAIVATGPVQAP